MNPDTRRFELFDCGDFGILKQGPVPDLEAALPQYEGAHRIAEPHKRNWTTFAIGEQLEVRFKRGGKPFYWNVRVKNIHADGLLLSAPHLNDSFFPGQEVTVKGEACRVGLITSKGMYVQGA